MTNQIFKIELLPAKQGDAIWIEYDKGKRMRRILIDGGPINAYDALEDKLKNLPDGDKRVELMVITHVDTDHIEGIIRLLAEKPTQWPIFPKDIWFNGWRHLTESAMLGGREGDFLSALISRRADNEWNKAFNKNPVVVLPNGALNPKFLEDDMKITILSPDQAKLKKMKKRWEKDVGKFDLKPGDLDRAWEQLIERTKFHSENGLLGGPGEIDNRFVKQLSIDQSIANGASIAFLAEFKGKSSLFLGDAHADIIARSIKKLIPNGEERLKVDAVKMSHHGSKANISKELITLLDAKHYLFSTNGAIHEHPDEAAINLIIQESVRDPVLWFNYRTKKTLQWENGPQNGQRNFKACYPLPGKEGVEIDLMNAEV